MGWDLVLVDGEDGSVTFTGGHVLVVGVEHDWVESFWSDEFEAGVSFLIDAHQGLIGSWNSWSSWSSSNWSCPCLGMVDKSFWDNQTHSMMDWSGNNCFWFLVKEDTSSSNWNLVLDNRENISVTLTFIHFLSIGVDHCWSRGGSSDILLASGACGVASGI